VTPSRKIPTIYLVTTQPQGVLLRHSVLIFNFGNFGNPGSPASPILACWGGIPAIFGNLQLFSACSVPPRFKGFGFLFGQSFGSAIISVNQR
jgi:hypothetical protein